LSLFTNLELSLPSPLQLLESDLLREKKVTFYVKREDLIHPIYGGNKWRKLKYNLIKANERGKKTILTFGGAYSNHILATATIANALEFNTIGIIRGEETLPLNDVLSHAKKFGMQLHYVNRKTYRSKTNATFLNKLEKKYGDFYMIPEGGSNNDALTGCKEIVDELMLQTNEKIDWICSPCGTGGTLAGLAISNVPSKMLGIAVLKKATFLNCDVMQLIGDKKHSPWKINYDFHFGGYAKFNDVLKSFIKEFDGLHGIELEPIYSGKMFFALMQLIELDWFPEKSTIVALHTGGLKTAHNLKF